MPPEARTDRPRVFALARVALLMRSRFAQGLANEDWVHESGLRPPLYAVLHVIDALEPASQREVSDRVGLYPSDLVPIVDHLHDLGWVDRTRDPDDRRRYQLALTNDGRAALARLDRIARDVEDELLRPLDDELRDAFVEALTQLVDTHVDDINAAVGSRVADSHPQFSSRREDPSGPDSR